MHLSDKAVEPPGRARSDLDIFLDYAARMDFRDKDGGPLVTWHDPETAFEAWQRCSKGRPCDYSGLTYTALRGGTGLQWPVDERSPRGTERLYRDSFTWSHPDECESYGKDLTTGEPYDEDSYRALHTAGRAVIRPAPYLPAPETPSAAYLFQLTSGRTIYHFRTRTKTGRAPQLDAAAPDVWVEMAGADATRLDLGEGDLVEVRTPRGALHARLRITAARQGVLFVPFHYGYWDTPGRSGPPAGRPGRAANETTPTRWDPASKQPLFKTTVAAVSLVERAHPSHPPAQGER